MNQDDDQILAYLTHNDERGLRLMFDNYFLPLSLYSMKIVNDYSLAEDIVQETFIKIWERKMDYQSIGNFRNYLFYSVRNNTLKHLEKNKRIIFDEIAMDIADSSELDEQEDLEIQKAKLLDEIEKLPPKMKRVFEAIVFENMRYKEVAEEMDVSLNTIKTHFSRSLKLLRNSLDIIILILLS